jgi:hypothetical protein
MARPYKRSQLWVDGPFQMRLLIRMGSYLALYAFAVLNTGFFMQIITQLVHGSGLHKSLGQLYVEFVGEQVYLLYGFVVVAPCIALDMIKFSNRIAGPLFRCRRVMTDMSNGKVVPTFVPRDHDLMREFWPVLNALIETCNSRAEDANAQDRPQPKVTPTRTVHV